MFEGLVAASDGAIYRFEDEGFDRDLDTSPCPHPTLSEPRGVSRQFLRIRCEADSRVLSVADVSR